MRILNMLINSMLSVGLKSPLYQEVRDMECSTAGLSNSDPVYKPKTRTPTTTTTTITTTVYKTGGEGECVIPDIGDTPCCGK